MVGKISSLRDEEPEAQTPQLLGSQGQVVDPGGLTLLACAGTGLRGNRPCWQLRALPLTSALPLPAVHGGHNISSSLELCAPGMVLLRVSCLVVSGG